MTEQLLPIGYGHELVTIDEMIARHGPKMHPSSARRLWPLLTATGLGVGGGWRPTPSDTSDASRAGHSFHQSQRFASGFVGYFAVDLVARNGDDVHRAPTWDEVPGQGSAWAAECGMHANVSGEPWHLQPTDSAIGGHVFDGWQTWVNAGRPDPASNYPLSTDPKDDDMTDAQLQAITDRLDAIGADVNLLQIRSAHTMEALDTVKVRVGAIVADADRLADEVVGDD